MFTKYGLELFYANEKKIVGRRKYFFIPKKNNILIKHIILVVAQFTWFTGLPPK